MDFVDEQHVMRFKIGQDGRQIASAFEHRAGGLAQAHAHFNGDDVRQRRFAQPRRAEQQHVVERVLAALGSLDEDRQLLANLDLPDVLGQSLRAQGAFDGLFLRGAGFSGDQAVQRHIAGFGELVGFNHLRSRKRGNTPDGRLARYGESTSNRRRMIVIDVIEPFADQHLPEC